MISLNPFTYISKAYQIKESLRRPLSEETIKNIHLEHKRLQEADLLQHQNQLNKIKALQKLFFPAWPFVLIGTCFGALSVLGWQKINASKPVSPVKLEVLPETLPNRFQANA
ncbi:MAG: hypothetical protein ACKO34_07625 [Vampirovibrionales bacterium]